MNNTTIIVHNEAILTSEGKHTSKVCKPLIAVELQQTFNSRLDAAEKLGVCPATIQNVLNGNQSALRLYERDENGNKTRYIGKCTLIDANNPEEGMDLLMGHARKEREKRLEAERKLAEQKAEMAEFLAWKAEREAERKAEEERLATIEKAKLAVAKAEGKLERRTRMIERREMEFRTAIERRDEAARELVEARLVLENLMKGNE